MNNNVIWIRHIEKLYKNGYADKEDETQFQHDPGIKMDENTLINVENLVEELVLKYGIPKTIYVSPFLRTRQTTDLFLDVLSKNYDILPNVKHSTDIAEYLGFCRRSDIKEKADLHPSTKKHFNFNVYLGESLKHFKERVKSHLETIKYKDENIWVITHGLVINTIYNVINCESIGRPKPLEYIVYSKNELRKGY